MNSSEELDQSRLLRIAARTLSREGLVHAFGHCSIRVDDKSLLVTPPRPLGGFNAPHSGILVPIDGALPDGVLGEVRVHQAIYRKRKDVNAVCRITPPKLEILSLTRRTPKVRGGLSIFFDPCPPLWDDCQLLREDGAAMRLAEQLGEAIAIVMRANGAVVTGANIAEAVSMSWLLEEAAKVELELMHIGKDGIETILSGEDIKARLATSGHVSQRLWDYLTASDLEKSLQQA